MSRFFSAKHLRQAQLRHAIEGSASLPPLQEEFYERLGSDADTRLEPGYNQDEIFDDQFERRAHEKQRTPSASNAVAIVPATRGPWSGNNSLGIERAFAPDENNQQTILKLPEWDFPERWTVSLGIEYNPQLLDDLSFFNVIAQVEAGAGGAIQQFELDWAEGMTFSFPMNALNLVARYEDLFDRPLSVPSDLRLRATIGKGKAGGVIAPTRTLRTGPIANGSVSDFIKIPKFARRVTPIAGVGTSAPYVTTTGYFWQAQMNVPSTIGGFTGLEFLSFAPGDGIPIPPEARAIIVSNGSAFNNDIRLVFHLQL